MTKLVSLWRYAPLMAGVAVLWSTWSTRLPL